MERNRSIRSIRLISRLANIGILTLKIRSDGIAIMSFDSEVDMRAAWNTNTYKKAAKVRESVMRETAIGVHVASVDEKVKII